MYLLSYDISMRSRRAIIRCDKYFFMYTAAVPQSSVGALRETLGTDLTVANRNSLCAAQSVLIIYAIHAVALHKSIVVVKSVEVGRRLECLPQRAHVALLLGGAHRRLTDIDNACVAVAGMIVFAVSSSTS